jgi:putative PIN family toxin of toxin-antitoxin system
VKVVLDTNVVVSGVFFGGVPGRILSAWSDGQFVLVLSPAILDEYRRVGHELGRRYPEVNEAFEPVLTLIAMHALIVDALPLAGPVSTDPDDDMFLAAALAAQAEFIVSGDQDLLQVSGWREIAVLTPRQFLDQHVITDS